MLTLCWIIKSYLIYFFISVAFTFLLKLRFEVFFTQQKEYNSFLPMTSWLIIFFVIHTYAVQLNFLSILVGHLFDKSMYDREKKLQITVKINLNHFFQAFAAKAVTILVWLVTLISLNGPAAFKYILCISPNSALIFCFQTILQYDRNSEFIFISLIFNVLPIFITFKT